MPVNEIGNTPIILPTAVQGRDRNAIQPAQDPAASFNSALAAGTAAQALTPAQRAALLINEAVRNLSFAQPAPLDATALNPENLLLTAIGATPDLTPAQRAALQINENLLNLSLAPPEPGEALLTNETNPIIEPIGAALETSPFQQAADLVNETSTLLTSTPPARTLPPVTAATTSMAAVTQATNLPLPGVAPSPVALLATPLTTATTGASEALVRPQDQNLLSTAATQPRNPPPFAAAVYEIKNPSPAPEDPKPIKREILQPQPMGRVRPVDRLILKREWQRRRESGTRETVLEGTPDAEKSIRQVISQANDDLVANGLPLHLVLARTDEGYSLDIYNCSTDDMCRLEQEIPLDLKELTVLLDNIQHETGIIINVNT